MDKLSRSEFAYLFFELFDRYRDTLSDQGVKHPTKQSDILGYGNAHVLKENLGICQVNSSLSHVIYFEVKKKNYRFERHGFPQITENDIFQIQGGELQNSYQQYNSGYNMISLSSNYLKLYLFYLELSNSGLKEKAKDYQNVPTRLVLPYSTPKGRSLGGTPVRNFGSEIVFDIYLAAPILTLRLKIRENYKNFRDDLKTLLKDNFSEDIEKELVRHFFGFTTNDLDEELKNFESYIVILKEKLEGLDLKVFDSREEITKGKLPPVAQSQVRLRDDIEAINKSRSYVLISPYPRLFSSAWVEAGAAINIGKPCLFFCADRKTDLPFVLQERSGSLNFDVLDTWNINKDTSEEQLQNVAEGIRNWASNRLQKN